MYTQHMASRHRKIMNRWVLAKFGRTLQSKRPLSDSSDIAHGKGKWGESFSFYFKHSLAHSNPSHPAREVIISDTPKTVTKRQIN